MRRGSESCRKVLLAQWCVLHLELGLRHGGDSMESIGCVQGSQGSLEDVNRTPLLERSTPLFSGEMRGYLPGLDWSSRERSLSGRLVQSLVSGFAIHLTVGLSEEEGDAFLGAVGVDRMEEAPVVEMEGDMEVVDAEFECRD